MAGENDPVRKEVIGKEINNLTIEAGKISLSNEFSELIEGMGGTGLNAGTSLDYTVFYNTFPPYQINKWLEISSERFVNPVFVHFRMSWKLFMKSIIATKIILTAKPVSL